MGYIEDGLKWCYDKLQLQQEELLKKTLIDKGYPEIAARMNTAIFPKIASVNRGGWNYYYADDNSEYGAFIIAFSDYIVDYSKPHEVTVSFKHQTDHPLVEYTEIVK